LPRRLEQRRAPPARIGAILDQHFDSSDTRRGWHRRSAAQNPEIPLAPAP
jgi:hypothetical protein